MNASPELTARVEAFKAKLLGYYDERFNARFDAEEPVKHAPGHRRLDKFVLEVIATARRYGIDLHQIPAGQPLPRTEYEFRGRDRDGLAVFVVN